MYEAKKSSEMNSLKAFLHTVVVSRHLSYLISPKYLNNRFVLSVISIKTGLVKTATKILPNYVGSYKI